MADAEDGGGGLEKEVSNAKTQKNEHVRKLL